jgi:hypothetical protein
MKFIWLYFFFFWLEEINTFSFFLRSAVAMVYIYILSQQFVCPLWHVQLSETQLVWFQQIGFSKLNMALLRALWFILMQRILHRIRLQVSKKEF